PLYKMKGILSFILIASAIAVGRASERREGKQFLFDGRSGCNSTDTCSSKKGECKAHKACYLERGISSYDCTGKKKSDNPANCECCAPDKCPRDNDACSAQGGTCRKYCLGDKEDQLESITCNGSCKCCKPKRKVTTPPPSK
ncbi:unnamed protein product, partial [Meganyctiphanes norvegica]